MADRKQRFALLAYFTKLYDKATGTKLVVNKYSAQWDADALLESYGYELTKQLVDRYFVVAVRPTWKGFANNAQKVYDGLLVEQEDQQRRKAMRERAKEWLRD